jgi:hypothetical protein
MRAPASPVDGPAPDDPGAVSRSDGTPPSASGPTGRTRTWIVVLLVAIAVAIGAATAVLLVADQAVTRVDGALISLVTKHTVILTGAPTAIEELVPDVTEPVMLNTWEPVGHNDPEFVWVDVHVVVVPFARATDAPEGRNLESLPVPPVDAEVHPPSTPVSVIGLPFRCVHTTVGLGEPSVAADADPTPAIAASGAGPSRAATHIGFGTEESVICPPISPWPQRGARCCGWAIPDPVRPRTRLPHRRWVTHHRSTLRPLRTSGPPTDGPLGSRP